MNKINVPIIGENGNNVYKKFPIENGIISLDRLSIYIYIYIKKVDYFIYNKNNIIYIINNDN